MKMDELPAIMQFQRNATKVDFAERMRLAAQLFGDVGAGGFRGYFRSVRVPHGRTAQMLNDGREVLMFGANDYLGFATDAELGNRVIDGVKKYGVGATGTPVFYGRHQLVTELEERLAAHLGGEAAMVFTNGAYGAVLGILQSIPTKSDVIFHDEQMHACFYDGIKLSEARALRYSHNNISSLESLFSDPLAVDARDRLIALEGIFSMEGDQGKLREAAAVASRTRSLLMVDDAHGFLTMGATGAGTAEAQGIRGQPDLTVGTFAKACGVQGGFVVAKSKDVIAYLRVFARTYGFAVTPPASVAVAVLAAMDLAAAQPERRQRLWANMAHAKKRMDAAGLPYSGEAPLIRFRISNGAAPLDLLERLLHDGIYVNPVLYPGVPLIDQGFRATLTAQHTTNDIDRLIDAMQALLQPANPQ